MYLDSAILVKLVVREPDSLFYVEQVHGQTGVWSSRLALTECWSALFRKQKEGALDARTRRTAFRKLEGFVAEGAVELVPVDEPVLRGANLIIERCYPSVPLRSLDAIHLASCEAAGAFPLLTNDQRMRAAGLHLRFPLGPVP
ncbi:MAG: type II toxin-antitoxin system VapC family toxin [Vicinamibacteria bacterium]